MEGHLVNLLFVVGKLKHYRLVKTQDYFVVYTRVGFVTAEEFLEVLLCVNDTSLCTQSIPNIYIHFPHKQQRKAEKMLNSSKS